MNTIYQVKDVTAQALTFEEEIAIAKVWRNSRRKAAREKLVKNYLLFAIKISNRSYPSMAEDDRLRVAHRAILEAIDKFDPYRAKLGRLSNLIPFYIKVAARRIRREDELIKCPVKKTKDTPVCRYATIDPQENRDPTRRNQEASVMRFADPSTDFFEAMFGDQEACTTDIENQEKRIAINVAITKLSKMSKKVLTLVYFKGLNFAEVARKETPEISREAVRQRHNQAIIELRDILKKNDIFN